MGAQKQLQEGQDVFYTNNVVTSISPKTSKWVKVLTITCAKSSFILDLEII